METIYQELLKVTVTIGLIVALWKMQEKQVAAAIAELKDAVKLKADKSILDKIEDRLAKSIEKIEERQTREVEGLRTEMGELSTRIDSMRNHLDDRFDKLQIIIQGVR